MTGTPVARHTRMKSLIRGIAACMSETSRPNLAMKPSLLTKSFWTSTTMSAVCDGSITSARSRRTRSFERGIGCNLQKSSGIDQTSRLGRASHDALVQKLEHDVEHARGDQPLQRGHAALDEECHGGASDE